MNEQNFDALPPIQNPNTNNQVDNKGTSETMPTTEAASKDSSGPSVGASFMDPSPPAQRITPMNPMPYGVGATTVSNDDATNPKIADDIDLIEKEWVVKAKQIVAQTKHDPFEQNQAMTQVKADYIKKRYNRELKKGEL